MFTIIVYFVSLREFVNSLITIYMLIGYSVVL